MNATDVPLLLIAASGLIAAFEPGRYLLTLARVLFALGFALLLIVY